MCISRNTRDLKDRRLISWSWVFTITVTDPIGDRLLISRHSSSARICRDQFREIAWLTCEKINIWKSLRSRSAEKKKKNMGNDQGVKTSDKKKNFFEVIRE